MKCFVDAHGKGNSGCPERDCTEQQFLEQFAVLEDDLARLQAQMLRLSENARRFGDFAERIRRSTCPAALSSRQRGQDQTRRKMS